MKLTIGMACHTDFDGVYMTINALRQYHNLFDCELVVVDNKPNSDQGKAVKDFLGWIKELPVRYIPFDEAEGTTQSRERIFTEALGDAVLVMDCHVLLLQGAVERLKTWYDKPHPQNLYSGPLYMDDLRAISSATHFDPVWRDHMWGIWASTWITPDNRHIQPVETGHLMYIREVMGTSLVATDIPWAGHEKVLKKMGYKIVDPSSEPFEIPAQGLGLFTCRKADWLGFNPHFREFGGEECYIHEKYRQAGRTTMCLPFLGWQHRFFKPGGIRYPINQASRFRNYVLGYLELGKDPHELVQHFEDILSHPAMNAIILSPEKVIERQTQIAPLSLAKLDKEYNQQLKQESQQRQQPVTREQPQPLNQQPQLFNNLIAINLPYFSMTNQIDRQQLYTQVASVSRDLDQHAKFLKQMASTCKHVTELTIRKESSVFLLAGDPDVLISYQEENDPLLDIVKHLLSQEVNNLKQISWTVTLGRIELPDIVPTELLFIDTRGTYESTVAELTKYGPLVSKYIVLHDTQIFGERGQEGGIGMGQAILEFLAKNTNWFIKYHTNHQYGMTTLCRIPEYKPEIQINPWAPPFGPGTELKKLLKKLNIVASPTCGCNAKVKQMDAEGPEWCTANLDKIVGWLKDEHKKQKVKLPFVPLVVRLLVRRAIHNAKKATKT